MIAPVRSEIRLLDVLRSLFGNRGYRERLEGELARYFGVEKVLSTHSARTALYLLLKALPHKRVYLPAYNCWAVPEAVLYAGKEPHYVDIRLQDYNMDLAKLRDALLPGSIILATHQFGIPCDLDPLLKLARERDCLVLEDNAAAFGSEYRGRKTGTFGTAGVLSFDYSKAIAAGKGGAILFNDVALYRRVKALQEAELEHPTLLQSLKYTLLPLAYSYATHRLVYRLTYALFRRIRGCSGSGPRCDLSDRNASYRLAFDDRRAKLAWLSHRRVAQTLARRKRVCDFYRFQIAEVGRITGPEIPGWVSAALVKFPIRLTGGGRQYFYQACLTQGLDPAFLFQFHFQDDRHPCPNAETAAREAMALPVYGALSSRDLARVKHIICNQDSYAPAAGGRA